MFAGLKSVIIIFMLIGLGSLFTKRKMWPSETPETLSVIVIKMAAPSLALISISDRFTPEMLRASIILIVIAFIHQFFMFILAKTSSRMLHLTEKKKIIYEVNFIFANVTFIGLPIIQIALGQEGIPYLFVMYIVTLITFWSLGAYMITQKSDHSDFKGKPYKKIFSPGLIAVILGIFLVEFRIDLPFVLHESITFMAQVCVPLSLLVIGAKIISGKEVVRGIKPSEILILLAKFIISPLLMLGLLLVFQIDGMAFKALLLASTMPCHMQTSIMAHHYNVESEYSSRLVGLSTMLCFVTIPLYVTLISYIS